MILHKVIWEAKRMYYNLLLVRSENTIKTTWDIVKIETGKECHAKCALSTFKSENN
jgi:hypothetical protein